MRIWLGFFILVAVVGIAWFLIEHRVKEPEITITQTAAPRTGFVCTTPITPQIRRVHPTEIA